MKKTLNVFALLALGVFLAGSAFADEQYAVEVLEGYVIASANGGIASFGGGFAPGTVLNLDDAYDPNHLVPVITQPSFPGFAPAADGDGDGWNAAGWWEFQIKPEGSTGSGWNEVFSSTGPYTFTADWDGKSPDMSVHFGIESATFDQMYGKWIENNPSVWTYFGLYVHPNTGAAQDPEQEPIGIFAFVADDPLLFPSGFDLDALYGAAANGLRISEGTGTFNASPVPEPTSLILLGSGLGVIGLAAWRRRK